MPLTLLLAMGFSVRWSDHSLSPPLAMEPSHTPVRAPPIAIVYTPLWERKHQDVYAQNPRLATKLPTLTKRLIKLAKESQ